MLRFFVKTEFYRPPKFGKEEYKECLLAHYNGWVKSIDQKFRNLRAEHDYVERVVYRVDDLPEGINPYALYNTVILWGCDSDKPFQSRTTRCGGGQKGCP
jgi:hypothetical protein